VEVATSLVTGLRLLVTYRTALVGDRVRMVDRHREVTPVEFEMIYAAADAA
jgi:hypothetical protein